MRGILHIIIRKRVRASRLNDLDIAKLIFQLRARLAGRVFHI